MYALRAHSYLNPLQLNSGVSVLPISMSRKSWKAGLTPEEFAKVRLDPRLPPLLTLARVANALSLSHHSLSMPMTWQTPRIRKQRTSGLLYAGAVLFEGLKVAEALKAHFGHLPQYQNGFHPILADRDVQRLRSGFLKPLRDQFTFHFDPKVPAKVLRTNEETENVVFLSAKEENAGGTYFDIADAISIQYLIGDVSDDAEAHERLEEFMVGTSNLFNRFTIASQRLIPAAFFELGVRRL